MKPLRILITNFTMAGRRGSVMYVRDLAWSLFRRGQHPVVYSPELGEVADELRSATIPVTDDLRNITAPPDVIIGNTHPDTMCALLQFPAVPAIFICHAWEVWTADPPKFPRLRRYVAVDETVRDWIVSQKGIAEDRVRLICNGVDLDRFQPRDLPLPEKPERAAVFSNHINEASGLGVIRAACDRAGITLDVIGEAGGQIVSRPEEILRRFDIVFAKARCALEAMTTGCAVIMCDYGKLGGIVTSQNWPELRRMNFGRRAIRHKLDADHVLAEIQKYDAKDARDVSRCIRDVASLDDMTMGILALAQETITEHMRVGSPGPEAEMRAAADYIRAMNTFADTLRFHEEMSRQLAQTEMLSDGIERLKRELADRSEHNLVPLQRDNAILQRELAAAHGQVSELQEQLRKINDSPVARLLAKLPMIGKSRGR